MTLPVDMPWPLHQPMARAGEACQQNIRDASRGGYVVDLDKERLRAAPSFTEGDSPDRGDRAWAGGTDTYYADRPVRPRDEQAIDDAVDDSFPASDPPSWSGGATGAGTPSKP